jgi:hypothetical protein
MCLSLFIERSNERHKNIIIYNDKTTFTLKNKKLILDNYIKFLGTNFNYKAEFSKYIIEKFKSVRNSFFSLNSCGLKPYGINPILQAFIYKTFCLSRLVYGLEFMHINQTTLNTLDSYQNILIKYMLGISKYSHVTDVFRVLKLFRINELYTFSKLSFIKNLKKNNLCTHIFNNLIIYSGHYGKNSKSFIRDINTISTALNLNIFYIYDNIESVICKYKADLRLIDEEDFRLMSVKNYIENINSDGVRDALHYTINYT